jgi:hypothetical protein
MSLSDYIQICIIAQGTPVSGGPKNGEQTSGMAPFLAADNTWCKSILAMLMKDPSTWQYS